MKAPIQGCTDHLSTKYSTNNQPKAVFSKRLVLPYANSECIHHIVTCVLAVLALHPSLLLLGHLHHPLWKLPLVPFGTVHHVSGINSLYLLVNLILVPVPPFPTHPFLHPFTTLFIHNFLSLFTPGSKPTCFTNPTPPLFHFFLPDCFHGLLPRLFF